MSDERITIIEAAERFGVSAWTLRKAALRGTLPGIQVGGKRRGVWLVYPADVSAYLTTHTPRVPKEVAE